jgi:hypothetical protein
VIEKGGGGWERYGLTDRIIEKLELDVEKGVYRYDGPIYQVMEGYAVFFRFPLVRISVLVVSSLADFIQ